MVKTLQRECNGKILITINVNKYIQTHWNTVKYIETYYKCIKIYYKYIEIHHKYIQIHHKYTISTFKYIQIYSKYIQIHSSTLKYFQAHSYLL
jgi:hypothetical protein